MLYVLRDLYATIKWCGFNAYRWRTRRMSATCAFDVHDGCLVNGCNCKTCHA